MHLVTQTESAKHSVTRLLLSILMLLGLSLTGSLAVAQNHSIISYQGTLNYEGAPTSNGQYQMTVTLYGDQGGTQPLWSDIYSVAVNESIFNVMLGSGKQLPEAKALDRPIWVGVRVGDSKEMRPLTRFSGVPFALNVADKSITEHKMGTDYVASVSMNGQKITGPGAKLNIKSGPGILMDYDELTNSLIFGSSVGKISQDPQFILYNGACGGGTNADGGVLDNTIGGGCFNVTIDATVAPPTLYAYGSILGGLANTALGDYAFIGGGQDNLTGVPGTTGLTTFETHGAIGGGQENVASGTHTFVGGGYQNVAPSMNAMVGGGNQNNSGGIFGAICGGSINLILPFATYGFIGGGEENLITDNYGVVGGGVDNAAGDGRIFFGMPFNAEYASVLGGLMNTAGGAGSVQTGGIANEIVSTIARNPAIVRSPMGLLPYASDSTGRFSAAVGGYQNLIENTDFGFIGGGRHNTLGGPPMTNALFSVIAGGFDNKILGQSSAIPGGRKLTLGSNSFGFNADTATTQMTDLTINMHNSLAYFGNADVWIGNVDDSARELRFYEDNVDLNYSANADYTGFRAPAVLGSSLVYTLPPTYPDSVAFLKGDSLGFLSWVTSLDFLTVPFNTITSGTLEYQTLTIGTDASIEIDTNGVVESNKFLYDVNGTDAVDLGSEVAGILSVTAGGTGIMSVTAGDMLFAPAANTLASVPIGTNGQILTVTGGIPSWVSHSATNPLFTNIQSGTNTSATMTVGSGGSILLTGAGIVEATAFKATGSTSDAVDLGTTEVSGTLGVLAGGTGVNSIATGDILYGSASNTISQLSIGTTGQILTIAGGVPTWATHSAINPLFTNIQSGTNTGATMDVSTGAAIVVSGTGIVEATKFKGSGSTSDAVDLGTAEVSGSVGVTTGGTGLNAATTGDLLYASASNTYSRLPIGSATQILTVSGGIPSWQSPPACSTISFANIATGTNSSATMTVGTNAKIEISGGIVEASKFKGAGTSSDAVDLATGEVGGTLGVGNGGTSHSSYSTGDILYASGTGALSKLAIGSTGQVLAVSGGVPSWQPSTVGWAITGNSSINPASNFLGTTDAQPLVIRTNNSERMRVISSGEVGIGTNDPKVSMDINGGLVLRNETYHITASNVTVTVGNRSFIEITRDNGGNRGFHLTGGAQKGQLLIVQGASSLGTKKVNIKNTLSNTLMRGNWWNRTLRANETYIFLWNGSKWVEISDYYL